MLNQLSAFLAVATARERADMAEVAGVHANQFHTLVAGRRRASADLAARIEHASRILHRVKPHLPIIQRTDTCETCASCPHAKATQ